MIKFNSLSLNYFMETNNQIIHHTLKQNKVQKIMTINLHTKGKTINSN